MGSSEISVTALGQGPHWEVSQEGTVIEVDGDSVDLDALQKDQACHYDFHCSKTGRYKATAILPSNDYLPVFEQPGSEGSETTEPPERLPIDLSLVQIRVYPWFDCEDPS